VETVLSLYTIAPVKGTQMAITLSMQVWKKEAQATSHIEGVTTLENTIKG